MNIINSPLFWGKKKIRYYVTSQLRLLCCLTSPSLSNRRGHTLSIFHTEPVIIRMHLLGLSSLRSSSCKSSSATPRLLVAIIVVVVVDAVGGGVMNSLSDNGCCSSRWFPFSPSSLRWWLRRSAALLSAAAVAADHHPDAEGIYFPMGGRGFGGIMYSSIVQMGSSMGNLKLISLFDINVPSAINNVASLWCFTCNPSSSAGALRVKRKKWNRI